MSGWHYAFGLSKQQVLESEPPGTVKLVAHEQHRTATGAEKNEDHIQLVPNPSSSPLDPLNWSLSRRYAILFSMCLFALAADISSGVVAPALSLLAFEIQPPQPLGRLSQLVSLNVLMFGVSNLFWVPLGSVFGRRPIFIVSTLLFTLCSMWCGLAKSMDSLLAARSLQGLSAGPAYSFAATTAGEIFFVHERGRAMAMYTSCLAAGPFIGGVAGGYITANLGYRYMFWISTALAAATFLLMLLVVPETAFDRAQQYLLEATSTTAWPGEREKSALETVEESHVRRTQPSQRLPYVQSLKFGPYKGHVLRAFAAPWLSLALPGTWVVALQYGGLVGGIVALATIGPILLSEPPYLWGDKVGLVNIGGLVGVIIGGLLTFVTADLLITWRAKHEIHGYSEPEIRLPLILPGVFLAVTGLWTFGFSAQYPSPSAWGGIVVGGGMLSAAVVMIPSVGFNYLIEAYGVLSNDCIVMSTVVRAVVAFAWTFFITDWVLSTGPAEPFGIFGMIMAIFGLLAVPLWIYGKRVRIATARLLPAESRV